MDERWVCKRCFADNDETSSACQSCGLIRGAEATEADKAGWATGAGAPSGHGGWQRWLRFWWVPVLAISLLVGYLTTARRDGDGALATAGNVTVDELRPGDCFNSGDEAEISDVDGVPCNEAHEFQVFAIGRHEADSFPTDTEMEAIFGSVCEGPFETFVGEPYASSTLWGQMITPSEESWSSGDRSFICILYDPNDPSLTASMEGANR